MNRRSGVRRWIAVLVTAAALHAREPVADTPELQAALTLYRARQDAEAQAAFEKILQAQPRSDVAYYYLGRVAKRRNDWGEAERCWKTCTELKPEFAEYWGALAEAYGERSRRNWMRAPSRAKPARAALEKAIALDPEDIRYRRGYAMMLAKLPHWLGGDPAAARAQAEEIKKRNPPEGWLVLGRVEVELKNWDAAERAFLAAAAAEPGSSAPAVALATLLLERGLAAKAQLRLGELLRTQPDNPAVLFHFARAALESGDQLERGEAAALRYLALPKRPQELPTVAEALALLGQLRERRGDRENARAAFSDALMLEPEQAAALAGMKRLTRK